MLLPTSAPASALTGGTPPHRPCTGCTFPTRPPPSNPRSGMFQWGRWRRRPRNERTCSRPRPKDSGRRADQHVSHPARHRLDAAHHPQINASARGRNWRCIPRRGKEQVIDHRRPEGLCLHRHHSLRGGRAAG